MAEKNEKKKKKKWNIPATILSVLMMGAVFYGVFWGVKNGPVKLLPAGDPAETVTAFMEAVMQGDEKAATLETAPSFHLTFNQYVAEAGSPEEKLETLLKNSLTYTPKSACVVENLQASQKVSVSFLQLSQLKDCLAEKVQAHLADFVEKRNKADVYDENNNYRPEIIEEAYELAVSELEQKDMLAHYTSAEIEVQLSYREGHWEITEAKGLDKALIGVQAKESANDFASVMTNLRADSLENLTYIRKIYTIPEHAMAPKENQACYGETTNPEDIEAVLAMAEELLEGQEVAWDPTVDFAPRSKIKYYCDETLLVICWKEIIEGKCCAMAEIKIADGSQLRRTIAGGEYGSSIQLLPTTMARESNAVLALSGDFYAFRPLGITVYDRKVYRFAPQSIDTCYFTAGGDMMFTYAGEPDTIEAAQKFVDDNDITFAVAFGPILVDHGQLREIKSYPIGEVHDTYSRTTFAQKDRLHYLLMCINYEGVTRAATINQSAKFIYDKGVQMAYALDGGQTSTMIINDTLYNCVDFNAERLMSDIIYFATALPDEEE